MKPTRGALWIDDNAAAPLTGFARVAPILAARYHDPVANAISEEACRNDWIAIDWNRFLSCDPSMGARTPGAADYLTAVLFREAGHVYMRGAWDDPDATWAFFGAGPHFAGHSRDDEGHFLIARKGWLVLRAGGQGHNDSDYYAAGSLAFNVVTVFDSSETMRRLAPDVRYATGGTRNENDGGLLRHVYGSHAGTACGRMVAWHHDDRLTYAAADLTAGYAARKVREVTRQFLYLRGAPEFIVVFDRIHATSPAFPQTWFLHIPGEPRIDAPETVVIPDHVFEYPAGTATWLSDPAGQGDGIRSTGGRGRS